MHTKRIMLVALALLLALSLSGLAAAQDPVQVQLMGWSSSEAENVRLQEVIDGFNESQSDIVATLNQVPDYDAALQAAIAGGTPPDVFYVDSFKFPDLYEAGALASGEGIITDPDDFYPSLRETFSADGEFICPPKDFSTLGLQINTDMFEAAGIEPPTSWEEMRAAAEALTSDDVVGLAVSNDLARWAAFLYGAGGSVANEDFTEMTINSPEALEALEFYSGLALDGFAATASDVDAGWPGEAFGQGKVAMATEGNWIYPYLKDNFPDLNFQVVELPEGPAGKATMAFTVCYGVASGGQNQEAAWALVNYLTGTEGMKAWTDLGLAMPTRISLREGWLEQFPDLEPFLNGAEYAHGWQFTTGFGDVLNTVNDGLLEMFDGSLDPQDLLDEVEEVGNEILAEAQG
jgi:multiple sugar transport system substrate-binding protein